LQLASLLDCSMSKLLNLWLLKKLLVVIHKPIIKLFVLAITLWISLALLEDIAKVGLLPLWMCTLIKWAVILAVAVKAWKQCRRLKYLVGRLTLVAEKSNELDSRWKFLLEKPLLMRRKDVIARKYSHREDADRKWRK
jgi:hypothetical protein